MLDFTKVSIAPLMGYTDRYFRYLLRLIHPDLVLYTEMLPTGRVIHAKENDVALGFELLQAPLVAQLGGGDPEAIYQASCVLVKRGYQHLNLNVGCPSQKVQSALMGAILFKHPNLVKECVLAMRASGASCVSVKTRMGVDDMDQLDDVIHFIDVVGEASVDAWIMHARKAWLSGLNPKKNRSVPPLRYEEFKTLVSMFPNEKWVVNGGIQTLEQIQEHLVYCDGVMLGRAVTRRPEMFLSAPLAECLPSIVDRYAEHIEAYHAQIPRTRAYKPLCYLMTGQHGVKKWRQFVAQVIRKESAPKDLAPFLRSLFLR